MCGIPLNNSFHVFQNKKKIPNKKYLYLQCYKVQLTQEFKPLDQFINWMIEMQTVIFFKKTSSLAIRLIFIWMILLISKVVGFGPMKILGVFMRNQCNYKETLFGAEV